MLAEPPVDRSALLAAIRTSYGVSAQELVFVPVGWGSVCYRLDETHFVKLWVDSRDAALAVRRLPLVEQLHASGFPARLPVPLRTRTNGLVTSCPDGTVAVFPLLAGATPPDWPHWPAPVLHGLGRVLTKLHATRLVIDLPREDFAVPHTVQRERLERLQHAVRRLEPRLVLCHTDLIGSNVLVSGDQLSALDWDSARFAPPECDLALLFQTEQPVDGYALQHVLEVYPADVPLHLDLFAFYLLRRYVEDYSARADRLSRGGLTPADAAEAREGMVTWGSAQWEALKRTLDLVRNGLRMRA